MFSRRLARYSPLFIFSIGLASAAGLNYVKIPFPEGSMPDGRTLSANGTVFGSYYFQNSDDLPFQFRAGKFTTLTPPPCHLCGFPQTGNGRGDFFTQSSDPNPADPYYVQSFLNTNGQFQQVLYKGDSAYSVTSLQVNNSLEIVGVAILGNEEKTFMQQSGETVDLPQLPDGSTPFPGGITNTGEVWGTAGETPTHPLGSQFLYQGGKLTVFSLPNATNAEIEGVTDSGIVWGRVDKTSDHSDGFVYRDGNTSIVRYPGSLSYLPTSLTKVNDAGEALGSFDSLSSFLLENGQYKTVNYPGADGSSPVDLNDAGVVLGTYKTNDGPPYSHAYLFRAGDYTELRPPDAGSKDDLFGVALDDAGDALIGRHIYGTNSEEFYLATSFVSTPEPSTWLLLSLGIFGSWAIGLMRRVGSCMSPGIKLKKTCRAAGAQRENRSV